MTRRVAKHPRERRAFFLLFTSWLLACGAADTDEPGASTNDGGAGGAAGSAAAGGGTGGADGGTGGDAGQSGECAVCEEYAPAERGAKLGAAALTELSGLVASRRRPGVFYAHNDSGDGPRLFAVTLGGALEGEHELLGAKAVDWEDIAAGPCAAGDCLFVADIGDNARKRAEVAIYRVDEAALAAPGGKAAEAEELRATYPDGPHDAETLLADPVSGDLFVVTKEESGPSLVFRLPSSASTLEATTLELVAQLTLPASGNRLATGGDTHPCAPRFLLRTYTRAYEFRGPPGGSLLEAFAAAPTAVPVASEVQGEAIAYLPGGGGFVTISEGKGPWINQTRCP
jgi:hypothetical protein